MIAVSDTGPLHYLSLIEQTGLLPQIYERVLIPQAVAADLSHSSTPKQASDPITNQPDWLNIRQVASIYPGLPQFGSGELEAISLAHLLKADILLIG